MGHASVSQCETFGGLLQLATEDEFFLRFLRNIDPKKETIKGTEFDIFRKKDGRYLPKQLTIATF